ncbi:hypothetical protein LCGC14_0414160 [marine sediment metagenome]|uniref:Uncharacterized protein n=1 Tax=marine sediment metagenome TaxID=412755 RepID=A0A0F9ST09_9ZZZZ
MATLNSFLNLADLYRRQDGKQKIARIIEILSETNPILADAPAIECNDGSSHLTTMRSTLPGVSWRILNKGVAETKSATTQVRDTTGIIEAHSRVDEHLVDISNDPGAFRASEAQAFLEAMAQEHATALFYHNTNTDPERILGLAPRFGALTGEDNSNQIISASGAQSDNTSIWFIVWGPQTCHLIYPAGTTAGMKHTNHGLQRVEDSDNNPYYAFCDQYVWHTGISVRDWRYIVRICNIDVSDLTVGATAGANLIDLMVQAYYQLQQRKTPQGMGVIYCNTTIKRFLHHHAMKANSNTQLSIRETVDGMPVVMFLDFPIHEVDAITDAEATVT